MINNDQNRLPAAARPTTKGISTTTSDCFNQQLCKKVTVTANPFDDDDDDDDDDKSSLFPKLTNKTHTHTHTHTQSNMGDTKYIASVVATYWFVSISMVYLNKVLMSSEGVSISAVRTTVQAQVSSILPKRSLLLVFFLLTSRSLS